MADKSGYETSRLENLWSGTFGEEYLSRNDLPFDYRSPFWNGLLERWPTTDILEVGCNIGGNLKWLRSEDRRVVGVDINRAALETLRGRYEDVAVSVAAARDLPFQDGEFGLVFTAGVLIHQPDESLHEVMAEMVRCSSRYVLCLEYYAPESTEVGYRGQSGALFKRDYRSLFLDNFPLTELDQGFLSKEASGWDDVSWWMFEKM